MGRILIADDDDDVRSFVTYALRGAGHEVTAVEDGQAAYDEARARAYHLVVTDLRMGRLDGLELVRRLRSEQPELEVIVLTAHGTIAGAVEAIKLGASEYLEKPLPSPEALRLTVTRVLERRSLRDAKERAHGESREPPQLTWGAPSMMAVRAAITRVAPTDATVLLLGESGTGKEILARALHHQSRRAQSPLVSINCASLSEQLLESELFGHERGAFTGAVTRQRGKLELAEGGTFFLDEIGELRLDLQAKLLRVLDERSYYRLGGGCRLEADVRWVAATNRDLQEQVKAGQFREDLYHRLALFPIAVPPLRDRLEDIPPLVDVLLARIARRLGRRALTLPPGVLDRMRSYAWPGNVRELANVLERAAILGDGVTLDPEPFASLTLPSSRVATRLEDLERQQILRALDETGGNRRLAAARLGIGLRTLYEKLKRYGAG